MISDKKNLSIYIYRNYKNLSILKTNNLKGRRLTDIYLKDSLKRYGVDNKKLNRTKDGKPFIEFGCDKQVYISVSHTEDVLVTIIAPKNVGIDIQIIREIDYNNLSRRYFTREEIAYICKNGMDAFFKLWVRKEAYSKYLGTGIKEIIKKTPVLNRIDVDFIDFKINENIYAAYCIEKS